MIKITDELGLKPSTVFMFDRIVFVEGPSDDNVLREFAKKLDRDVALVNLTFVSMGGSSRANQFAAESTMNLLSKRNIPLWFVIDRDEQDEEEIKKLKDRFADRAKLVTFKKRELENYLLVPRAVHALILEKLSSSPEGTKGIPTVEQIDNEIRKVAHSLRDRVIELNVTKRLLRPVFIERLTGSSSEKLSAAKAALDERISSHDGTVAAVTSELGAVWEHNALEKAPGSMILQAVFEQYNLRYSKVTDGIRIAEIMTADEINHEIAQLILSITAE